MKFLNAEKPAVIIEKMKKYYSEINIGSEKEILTGAEGRYVYNDICSGEDVPDFRRSTVDGYAVKYEDTTGASESIPAFFDYKGHVDMGERTDIFLKKGECVYVPTGGMIPEGSDAVVMIEYSEKID